MTLDLSLYKLADTLQIPLSVSNGKILGSQKMTWKTLGMEIPITLKAEKMYAGEQVGVLFHVLGDLHIIVSHFPKTGTVSIYMVDGSKTNMDGVKCPPEKLISKTMVIKEVMAGMVGAVVCALYWKQGEWKTLTLPK